MKRDVQPALPDGGLVRMKIASWADGSKEAFWRCWRKNPLITTEMQYDKLHNNETKGLIMENIQTGSLFCRCSSVSGILVKELLWIKWFNHVSPSRWCIRFLCDIGCCIALYLGLDYFQHPGAWWTRFDYLEPIPMQPHHQGGFRRYRLFLLSIGTEGDRCCSLWYLAQNQLFVWNIFWGICVVNPILLNK